MKKNIADMWIKALTSGKYKQGKYVLRNKDNKFCCLGVLCDLYNQDMSKNKKKTLKITEMENTNIPCYKYGNKDDYLPISVMKWAGMRTPKGEVIIDEEFCNLAMLNDGDFGSKSFSFKKIASVIKKNFETL